MLYNLSYFILFYIVIILTLFRLKIDILENNYIIIDKLNDIITKNDLIMDKYLTNKFNVIFLIRIFINIYIGYNRDHNLFIYDYIIIYIKNIIIESIFILSDIKSNIIIIPIIMTISDMIGKIFNKQKINNDKYDNDIYDNLL
jgi:hypothetical protein